MATPALTVAPLPAWRRSLSRLATRLNGLGYFSRWLILAPLIGVIGGLGAALFYAALHFAAAVLLGRIAGYHVPLPGGEGGATGSAGYARPWAIPLVVTLGGLLSGVLVYTLAPEAEGHGTDAAIDAVHHNPRGIRLRAVVVKIVASALTIGSGGSGGREGPTAQISAGFGSLLARVLDLPPEDGRVAVSVGIGSGIGAIFGAPLGGAVLAGDVVYRDDFEYDALIPGVFASVVAYAIFGAFFGYQPLFRLPGGYHFEAIQLAWFAVIGVLAGGIGLLYSKCFYGVVALTRRLPFSVKLRPAAGALAMGLLALWLPELLGTGYGWIQKGLANDLLHTPLYIILLLPFLRILATALSIGSGGSGGVFGPGMVIGAFSGLALWRLLEPVAPGVGHNPAAFIVVGMMAVFGGISRAPVAVMLMVAEMTGSVSLLAPAMVAVSLATFIVGRSDDSIYRSQLRTRADSPAGRLAFAMPLVATITVEEVTNAPRVVLRNDSPAPECLALLRSAGVPGAPLVDPDGTFLGAVDTERLDELVRRDPKAPIEQACDVTASTVAASARLDVALDAIAQAGGRWVTVTGESRRVAAVLAVSDVVRGYRRALRASAGQLSLLGDSAVNLEARVGPRSPLVRVALRDAGLPPGCIVVTAQRGDQLLFATGDTVLEQGDVVSVLAPAASAQQVSRIVRGSEEREESLQRQAAG